MTVGCGPCRKSSPGSTFRRPSSASAASADVARGPGGFPARLAGMPLSSESRIGPYEIVGPIGAGGMGEVYRARDTALDRDVAVKVLPPDLSANPDFKQRFE